MVTFSPVKELSPSTVIQEGIRDENWRSRVGVPQRWALFDGATLVLVPSPSVAVATEETGSSSYGITVGYTQAPALLSSDSDTVDSRIPLTVQQYLKYEAAAWLLKLDQSDASSLQTAEFYSQTFRNLIGG